LSDSNGPLRNDQRKERERIERCHADEDGLLVLIGWPSDFVYDKKIERLHV
jgi:hypothetical protein